MRQYQQPSTPIDRPSTTHDRLIEQSMAEPPKIFVIDDDDLVRGVITKLLDGLGAPIKGFANAEEFLPELDDPSPGCVVLDIRLTGISGLELQKKITTEADYLPIFMVSGYADVPLSVEAMRNGASDLFQKPFEPQGLRRAVEAGLLDAKSRWVARSQRLEVRKRVDSLTPRELEVLEHLKNGKSIKELAASLGISPSTAEKHRLRVYDKLGVRDVPQLLLLIQDAGV